MERFSSVRALNYALLLSTAFVVSSLTLIQHSQALTASYGRPYNGRLENGVTFPTQFPGYNLRDVNRAHTTPEVAGALLDAIEAVRTQFPDTCDLFIGDFSSPSGGSFTHHRSHQNGRDVDIGMYAKGNRRLDSFIPMGEENLDAAKTWCLIENLIRSQRVQYIFLDHRVQKPLYDYAVTRGYDEAYISRVFGNVRGSLIQHVRNHVDHMHIRFFTPWSTLAAHIGEGEVEKRMVIEMAQQSYLPKKVNYYVNGSEKGMDALAKSFGVTVRDLCKWNSMNTSSVLVPGSCLVFYKRSFESEPVQLARSLQPGFIAEAPTVRMASLRSQAPVSTRDDASGRTAEPERVENGVDRHGPAESRPARAVSKPVPAISRPVVYTVRKGDTLDRIARAGKLDIKLLCQLNGITKTTTLKPGLALKTGRVMVADAGRSATDAPRKSSSSAICFSSDPKKPNSPTAAYYTVGKGDTLRSISRKSGISIDSLCQLNALKRSSGLKPGQKIKLTQANLPLKPALGSSACAVGKATAVKAKTAHPAKGVQNAKTAVRQPSKTAAKKAETKSVQKVAAGKTAGAVKSGLKPASGHSVAAKLAGKSAAVAKPAAKPASGPAKAVQKAGSQKAIEAKKAVKPTPAAAQKKPAPKGVGKLARK